MGGPSGQEKQQQQQSFNQLGQTAQTAFGAAQPYGQAGTQALGAGKQTLDSLTKYFQSLLGGTRSDVMKAIEPAVSSATAASDAQKRQQASMGTARTGGTAAGNQQADDQLRAQIDNLIASVGPQAAGQLATIANQYLGLGQTDVNAMMNALGLSSGAAGTAGSLLGNDINAQRQQSAQLWGSLLGGATSLLTAPLGGASTGGTLLGKIF